MADEKTLHLVGKNVVSIAPRMHNYVARALALPGPSTPTICPNFSDVIDLLHSPSTAGLTRTGMES